MTRALVEQAMAGDHDAFAELARAASGQLFATARLILRDSDQAQDAVQEALIAAWRGIRALREPDAWEAWLRRLVVRACYRIGNARRRVSVAEISLDREPAPVLDAAIALADRDQLERGFARLAVEQRAILVAHYYLGLPLTEAAVVLGIPPGTAKSRLHRATQAMRAALDAGAREAVVAGESVA